MPEDEDFDEVDGDDNLVQLSKKDYDDLAAKARTSKKATEELAAGKAAARELAFVKAGVDTDSKLGQLLMRSYDGELTADGIRAEAIEIGLIQAPSDPEIPVEEQASTDERQQLASNAPPDIPAVPDPIEAALRAGKDAIDKGASQEDGIGLAFRELLLHGQREKSGDTFQM